MDQEGMVLSEQPPFPKLTLYSLYKPDSLPLACGKCWAPFTL